MAAVLSPASPTNPVSDPFFSPSPQPITIISAPIPSSSRSKMPSPPPNKPPKPQKARPSPEVPTSTLHRIRSSLESIRYSTRASRANATSPTPAANELAQSKNKMKKSKGTKNDITKDMNDANKKDIDETKEREAKETKEKPSMLRRVGVLRRSATPTSQSPSAGAKKTDPGAGKVDEPRAPSNRSFVPPTLQQATMSSPALHLASQAIPSPRSRPAAAASTSSGTDPLVSPPRERRASLQSSSRVVSGPMLVTPRRSSKEYARPSSSRPPPLILPSHPSPSKNSYNQGSPGTPTKKAPDLPSPPDTPTRVDRRTSLSTTSPPQRMPSLGSNARAQSNLPTPQPRSPSRIRGATPINTRGLTSASTTNLPSTNHERRRGCDSPSPPRVSSAIRPRAVSPSYVRNRQFNASTTSLCAPSTFEQRELIRNAISILCKEMSRQPPHLSRSAAGGREWQEVEKRMDGLLRLWGRGVGGLANGSSSQLLGTSNRLSPSAEERERKLFSTTLRDGYVLCQLFNKLRSAAVLCPDPREDGVIRTLNVTKFLAACSKCGVPPTDQFLRDDLIETTAEPLSRVARTIISLLKHIDAPTIDPSKYLRGQGKKPLDPRSDPKDTGATHLSTHKRSPAAASTPNLSLDQALPSASSKSPIQKRGSSSPDSPTVGQSSGSMDKKGRDNDNRGIAILGSDRAIAVNGVPPLMAPPPRSPLRARSPALHVGEANSITLSSNALKIGNPLQRNPTKEPTRESAEDTVPSDLRKRPSVASTNITESTVLSSMFDVRVAANKFDTLRTATTEPTEPPSLTRTEGNLMAAFFDEKGRVRRLEHRKSEDIADLSKVVEEQEDVFGITQVLRDKGWNERKQEGAKVEKTPVIRLGKGKWPDDFLDAFQAHNSGPIPIKQPLSADRDESRSVTPVSNTPPSITGPRKLAIVGRRNESVESLPQFPRRPLHRARHSIETASALAPKDQQIRDSSPDGLAPAPRIVPRRHSTKPSLYRNEAFVSRGFDEPNPDGGSTDSLVPFPKAPSGDLRDRSISPIPLSESRRSSDSPILGDRPRFRGRFQSEIDGASSKRRGRPYSYDELGAKPIQRSRYESMVNLGVTSNNASASDYMLRESLDGDKLRKTLTIKEEGKPPTHFQLGNCIGRGQFGSVYRALNLNTGQMVAVKCIRLEGLKEEEVTQLMREVDLVKSLSHPSIVKYEGMVRDKDTLNIVLEYVENGSLGQTLKAFGKLHERLVASYVVKILEGLHYLHQSEVVHCDLKAANILTTKNGNVKLADFGVSLNLRAMERDLKDVAGTPNWMAPEVIELKGASPKSDIWSLGCTVIELLTGRPPYADISNSMSVMFRIVEDKSPPIPEGCSDTLQDFLMHCFHKRPDKRPTADKLCEHPWLKQNWGIHKELRPQDSIPFLRRVSADLQKNEFARFFSQLDLSESPVSENRSDDLANGSPPRARRVSNPLVPPSLSQDGDATSPREHTFVKTTFSKSMVCRVCLTNVKKSAVFCEHCSLISHSKCVKDAPQTCDLRTQLWSYARYAEQSSIAGTPPAPTTIPSGMQQAAQPPDPWLEMPISRSPKTSSDSPQPHHVLPVAQSPPKSKAPAQQSPSGNKFMAVFKRSRAITLDPIPIPSRPRPAGAPTRPLPPAPNDPLDELDNRRLRFRSESLEDSDATPNSLRSTFTAAESVSSRQAGSKSDAGTRTSTSRFSIALESELQQSSRTAGVCEFPVVGAGTDRRNNVPGAMPQSENVQSKRHISRSSGTNCTVQ